MAWQVGHIVARHAGGTMGWENQWPECRRCNLSAGGKIGSAITNAKRQARKDPPARVVITGTDAERGLRGW
jgi:5-methylcytosine-specific restriction endonuclease McrA